MKTTRAQNNLNGGEVSPRALGRFDLPKFVNGLKILENFLINLIGGVFFRPGTVYVAAVKDSTARVQLIVFQYSTSQGYVIEAGNLYFRYFTQNAQLISGTPVETVTPYLIADVRNLKYTQNANTQYFAHNGYAPYKHTRTSATAFAMVKVPFVRGPFLDANLTKVTITPGADTGNTTLTAAAVAWAAGTSYVSGPVMADFVTNGGNTYQALTNHVATAVFANDLAAGKWVLIGAGNIPVVFQAGHVGALWRVKSGVVQITAVTNSYTATVSVQAEPSGTAGNLATGPAAVTDWAEGAFSGVRGYPAAVVFHGQRLYYAGTTFQPQTFWGSYLAQYDNFDTGSSTSDSNAITFTLGSDQVNSIRWLASVAQALQNGTFGGTFSANPAGASASITPTSIQVSDDTSYGVASIAPKKLASYLYYLQKNGFALRELAYNYLVDRQVSTDLTDMADHILRDGSGAADMDYQQSPNDRLWVVRNDGQIAVLIRSAEQKVAGWSRLVMGRSSGGEGVVESIAVLQNDAGDDQVWVSVKRVINGSTVRWVEYFSAEYFTNPWDPIRLDASSTYDVPLTITGMTNANPGVFTSVAHGLSNADQVKIDLIKVAIADSVTEQTAVQNSTLNGNIFYIANATANTFTLVDADGNDINTSAIGTYISGGQVRKMVTTISGLSYLNGEVVSVTVDGGLPSGQQTYTVAAGAITLAAKAAVVHVGLAYTGTLQFLKFSDGAIVGQTKMRRVYLSTLRVVQSLRMKIGLTLAKLTPVYFQEPDDALGQAPPLFTGDIDKFFDTSWEEDSEIIIQQDQPLPLFILAAFFRSEVEESS